MCRSASNGGRRCPGHSNRERTRALNTAHRAVERARHRLDAAQRTANSADVDAARQALDQASDRLNAARAAHQTGDTTPTSADGGPTTAPNQSRDQGKKPHKSGDERQDVDPNTATASGGGNDHATDQIGAETPVHNGDTTQQHPHERADDDVSAQFFNESGRTGPFVGEKNDVNDADVTMTVGDNGAFTISRGPTPRQETPAQGGDTTSREAQMAEKIRQAHEKIRRAQERLHGEDAPLSPLPPQPHSDLPKGFVAVQNGVNYGAIYVNGERVDTDPNVDISVLFNKHRNR